MATGLFKMLQSVQSTDEMLGFLDSSTFDVLIEFDLNSRTFQKIYDVSKNILYRFRTDPLRICTSPWWRS